MLYAGYGVALFVQVCFGLLQVEGTFIVVEQHFLGRDAYLHAVDAGLALQSTENGLLTVSAGDIGYV